MNPPIVVSWLRSLDTIPRCYSARHGGSTIRSKAWRAFGVRLPGPQVSRTLRALLMTPARSARFRRVTIYHGASTQIIWRGWSRGTPSASRTPGRWRVYWPMILRSAHTESTRTQRVNDGASDFTQTVHNHCDSCNRIGRPNKSARTNADRV